MGIPQGKENCTGFIHGWAGKLFPSRHYPQGKHRTIGIGSLEREGSAPASQRIRQVCLGEKSREFWHHRLGEVKNSQIPVFPLEIPAFLWNVKPYAQPKCLEMWDVGIGFNSHYFYSLSWKRDSGRASVGCSCRKAFPGSNSRKSWEVHSRGNSEFPREELELGFIYWELRNSILSREFPGWIPGIHAPTSRDLGSFEKRFWMFSLDKGWDCDPWGGTRKKAGFGTAQGLKAPWNFKEFLGFSLCCSLFSFPAGALSLFQVFLLDFLAGKHGSCFVLWEIFFSWIIRRVFH